MTRPTRPQMLNMTAWLMSSEPSWLDAQGNVHIVDDNTQNIDISEPEGYDKYIGCRVIMDEGVNGGGNLVTVKNRATDD